MKGWLLAGKGHMCNRRAAGLGREGTGRLASGLRVHGMFGNGMQNVGSALRGPLRQRNT